MKTQTSLLALMSMMVFLSQPVWSMEEDAENNLRAKTTKLEKPADAEPNLSVMPSEVHKQIFDYVSHADAYVSHPNTKKTDAEPDFSVLPAEVLKRIFAYLRRP